MLVAKRTGYFTGEFRIEAKGQPIARLGLSNGEQPGEVWIEGRLYKPYREGFLSGAFILESEGQLVARAIKPSMFRSHFEVDFQGFSFSLRPATFLSFSLLGQSFVASANGSELGAIRPTSPFSKKVIINLPAEWPVSVQIFVFWLVLVIWDRQKNFADV